MVFFLIFAHARVLLWRFAFFKNDLIKPREDKGDREGIPHTHPIPLVNRLELFLRPQIPIGIRQQPIT